MAIELIDVNGNVNVGLYAVSTNNFVLVPEILPGSFRDSIKRVLKSPIQLINVDPSIIGAIIVANDKGILLSTLISPSVEEEIRMSIPDVRITRLDFDYFAVGNLIIATNDITLVPPIIPVKTRKIIEETLQTEVVTLKLNESDLLGSLVVTNSLGAVTSPLISNENEIENLFDILGIEKVETSTVNRGAQFPSSGIICNKVGALIGSNSTGLETISITNGLFPA